MSQRFYLFLASTSLLFMVNTSYSQISKGTNEELAMQHARNFYSVSLSVQAGIYSGPEYTGYPYRTKEGHPFFLSPEMQRGEIRYDGLYYRDVPMWYDLAKDEVVVQYVDNFSKISLHKEKVSDFTISGHHFINIQSDNEKTNLENGIYDQIYGGKSQILVKRSKSYLREIDSEGIWFAFSRESTTIFLRAGEIYEPVSSQKSVLNALGKYQKEIQTHLRQSKINFRREREKAIILMAAYFDQLNSRI